MSAIKAPRGAVRKRGHIVLAGVALAGFLTYAMVIPYMMIATIKADGHDAAGTVRVSRIGWFTGAAGGRRMLGPPVHQQQQQQQQGPTWQTFWNSDWENGLKSFQQLKHTLDMMRYQRLTKDVEDQATAGLDIAMAEQLRQLANITKLEDTQAWLRKEVTAAVFQHINNLQHPPSCSAARKLVCDLNKSCGFGCQIHHVVHCLAHAIAWNRTMVLKTFPSNYITQPDGWEQQMLPVSNCTKEDLQTQSPKAVSVSSGNFLLNEQEVMLPIIDSGVSEYDPPAMPQDVLEVVQLFNARPEIWWTGILSTYIMRPSEGSVKRQAEFKATQNWTSPIVGVHVRRTDKLQMEAKLHRVDEYMRHVERYCDMQLPSGWQIRAQKQLEDAARNGEERKSGQAQTRHSYCSIYLATDEETVANEIRNGYKHIHVITNDLGLKTSDTSTRFSINGLVGILDDVTYLADTDLLVGTFSSQVSRLAYEVSQVNHSSLVTDRTFSYHSVDSMWYYGGQMEYLRCAAHDFTSAGSVSVTQGERLICPIISVFDQQSGLMQCFVEATKKKLDIAPASVVDCVPGTGQDDWNVLPEHMRRPVHKAAMPAADAGAQVAAAAGGNVAAA